MPSVCLYLQVHQPCRLRPDFSFFKIGKDHDYEDDGANRVHLERIAARSYLPTAGVLYDLVKKHEGRFRLGLSFSSIVLEQLAEWAPAALDAFRRLVATGCVEVLSETSHHSLASLYSEKEFLAQVAEHRRKVKEVFGVTPAAFRNTELIYDNQVAVLAEKAGCRTVLAEGSERLLGWRSPRFVYAPSSAPRQRLLLRDGKLSDDLAFRFSDPGWAERPLTAEKFASWIHGTVQPGTGETVNLFLDFETFGEHHAKESGIFDFLWHFPEAVLAKPDWRFLTPSETTARYASDSPLDVPHAVSWADQAKDLSAWRGNPLQDSALQFVYSLEKAVLKAKDAEITETWRRLLTSDHFYYMYNRGEADGAVHGHFRPFASPYDAYVVYINILNDLKEILKRRGLRV